MPRWQDRWRHLVQEVVRVHSERGEQQLVETLASSPEPRVLAFINAHAMNSAAESRQFYEALMSADVVLRDGSGMAILMRLLNQPPGLNLNGTDLIPKILQAHDGRTIALFGTQQPWLAQARDAIRERLCPRSHLLTAHGFHDAAMYLRIADAHKPALIVLGMGMPRQEQVAQMLRNALGYPCLIVCGGAILDFLGGKAVRAPRLVRAIGMEWAWRLGLEPRRLFRRYVLGNPIFLARALGLAAAGPRGAGPRAQT